MEVRPFQHGVLENLHGSRISSVVRVPPSLDIVEFLQLLLVEPGKKAKTSISIIHNVAYLIEKLPDASPKLRNSLWKLNTRSNSASKQ